MDAVLQSNIDELIIELKESGINMDDPVSKLMVSTLLYQARKIRDEIYNIPDRVLDRLCSYFIPANKICAMPALCLVQPSLKGKKGVGAHLLSDGTFFTYKMDGKLSLSYYPLYRNLIVPVASTSILAPKFLLTKESRVELSLSENGHVWFGLEVPVEIDSLEGVSFYIRGTSGVLPERIFVGAEMKELSYATAENMSDIPMMEPFDSQQATPSSIDMFAGWKSVMTDTGNGRLIYITDPLKDRDIFKCRPYPKSFQQLLESTDLDKFESNTLWILFDFGNDYEVPADIEIMPNVVPVANVNVNTVSLTQSSPIAKLTKSDGSYFLNIVETSLAAQKQGFNAVDDEVVVRDFDSSCYNPGVLYRDVRNLYNRFIEDYHAFVEYHGLKDGELIRSLRELVNKIGKSVVSPQDIKSRYDEGTYAMRSIGINSLASAIKVSYLTTFGRLGNSPCAGNLMENKKDAAIDKEVKVIVTGAGGEDKAGADQRYEMLRYYALTSDRLFTKMDIDAFIRMWLLKEFGREEVRRISHEITVRGAGCSERLARGLYIDIRFKDRKNYDKALHTSFDKKLKQMILDKSCLSMPVIVNLICSEA